MNHMENEENFETKEKITEESKIDEEDNNSEIDKFESQEEENLQINGDNNEKEESEKDKELEEDKNLVEHVVNSIEHITSETAQEMDESAENENMKKVEAALFIAGRFLTLQELVMLTDINPLMIKEFLEKLIEKYNDNSGIEIIEKNESWKMDVRQEHVSMINKLATGSAEFSKAEQETLAVIAYKQPVKQSVIIKIRGNKAYDHIKHFIDINLVQAKKDGRTRELKLSDDFYEYFHLREKGDGSTEILDIENNEDSDNVNSDKFQNDSEEEQEQSEEKQTKSEGVEQEKETDENQEGVKEIKMESESDVESETESESPPDENSEDLEKE